MKTVTSILFKKLSNGNYQNPNDVNSQITAEAIHKEVKKGLPGCELYYDKDDNVCVKMNMIK